MKDELIDAGPPESEDIAQWYNQSGWPNNLRSALGDESASSPTVADTAVAHSYAVPDRYAPGLLGDVKSLVAPADDSQPSGGSSISNPSYVAYSNDAPPPFSNGLYDDGLAHPGDGGLLLVGNPAIPRLRREWSKKKGRDWPTDPVTGRNHDAAHIVAKADGGQDHVDNIRPMLHDDHMAEHTANGDWGRWGRRSGTAKAFGGTVGAMLPLEIFSGLLGIVSGRTRMDSFNNFMSDMVGMPSREDQEKALETQQRALNPSWKSGDNLGV